jgi:hypothetical protein
MQGWFIQVRVTLLTRYPANQISFPYNPSIYYPQCPSYLIHDTSLYAYTDFPATPTDTATVLLNKLIPAVDDNVDLLPQLQVVTLDTCCLDANGVDQLQKVLWHRTHVANQSSVSSSTTSAN